MSRFSVVLCMCLLVEHARAGRPFSLTAEPSGERTRVIPSSNDMPPADPAPMDGPYGLLNPAPLTEPLVTDRPDFTESAETVLAGHAQFELGYTFTYNRDGTDRSETHVFPELLVRIGLVEHFELRLFWAGYSWSDDLVGQQRSILLPDHEQSWTHGANDMSVGFKLEILERDGWVPDGAILAEVSIPTGSQDTTLDDVEVGVGLLWAYDVTDAFSVSGNVNFVSTIDADRDRFLQTSASLALGLALTDDIGIYWEYFGFYPDIQHEDCAHFMNGGMTFLLTDNLQFDLLAGFGLNEQADDLFAGIGVSWRI